jgi:hemolysin activation/secretion protein
MDLPFHPLAYLTKFSISSSFLLLCINPSYGYDSFYEHQSYLNLNSNSIAQQQNQDRFPQPAPDINPLPPENTPPIQPIPKPEAAPLDTSITIQVKKVNVTGSTIFKPEKFNSIMKSVEGREVSLEELRKIADAITQLYLDRGYITSRAVLVDQTINDGVVEIRVFEGGIEKIEIQGTKHLNPNYVRSRIALGTGQPLSTEKLENQLRLLRFDPLLENIEASLRPGTQIGKSILVVRVTENRNFSGQLGVDNFSPPSIGSERLGISGSYNNLTGNGDEIAASFYRTLQGGANIYDASYRLPINGMNGTLQLRTNINNNEVVQGAFKNLQIGGESQLYEINYRQPIVRSPKEELALSLGFAVQNGQTFLFAAPRPFGLGPDKNGNSRTRVVKFGQDYVVRDSGGAWSGRSLFSFGVGLFDGTINDDPIPDSRFFSWLAQIQRVQRINQDNLFIASAELQLTPDPLLPSQQFVVGGGQSVRGFRQNARAADNGFRLSIENRMTIGRDGSGNPLLQIAPFFDAGMVWNVDKNPNLLQSQRFLAGTGIGVLVQPLPGLNIRVDYAIPLVDLDDKGNNAQDDGLYFSVGYGF